MNLLPWLNRLEKIGSIEAADGYWGVSRGVEIIPQNIKRESTSTPNYYKKEDEGLVKQEVLRVLQDGHLITYNEVRKIYKDAPETPSDRIALGFLVKDKIDPITGKIKKKLRLLSDASRPKGKGKSVNSCIKHFATALPTVAEFATHLERGDWMAMADIADAFHNLGLRPYNWANITFEIDFDEESWKLAYVKLCFGVRSAVRIFQALAQLMLIMIRHECKSRGFAHLIRHDSSYIDDSACIAITKGAAQNWLKSMERYHVRARNAMARI